ncbi:MAG TPA: helix-turn-helix transcriptional regulator [bacterium]|jgi:DNA-binding NarL/FixJ family response regulator|nr:helix-turn-helix transcriptional regulator [bacterium]
MHELLSSLHHPAGCELPALSQRQLEILREIYYGKKISEIACELKISENTIKYHIKKIFRLLEIKNRSTMIRIAVEKGWVK